MALISYCVARIDERYPFTFVDIGAMGGIPRKWDPLRGHMRVLAFEPDEREFKKLKSDEHLCYFNCLVYSQPADLKFYVSKDAGRSSVFPSNLALLSQFPDVERFQTVETVAVESCRVKSIDAIIRENKITDVDFMKVDTEGTELAIFQGSREEVLPRVFGLQIEVEFIEKCLGQPLFRDVDAFVNDCGFQIMDLRRQFWKRKDFSDYNGKGQLVFGDALYFKRLEAFTLELSQMPDAVQRHSKIVKAVLCCWIYRLFDYAVAVVDECRAKNFLTTAEAERLTADIRVQARRGRLPDFPGRSKLYAVLNRLLERLRPKSFLGFSDSDRDIGNVRDH